MYVVVCRGPNCRARGGLQLRKDLVRLLKHHPSTTLIGYACFGQCDHGPNVAFLPEGDFYGSLNQPDSAERVVRHATIGEPMPTPPLSLPEAERTEHLRNIGDLVRTLERDRARPRRWWWPF